MGIRIGKTRLGLLLGLCCLSSNALADDASLKASPGKCVSLKQGSVCYAKVTLRWQAAMSADYCLYQGDNKEPMRCWQQAEQGEHQFEFAFPVSRGYQLRRAGDQAVSAQTRVEVKWVYKSRRDRRFNWRVF